MPSRVQPEAAPSACPDGLAPFFAAAARMASELCGKPIALVGLIDDGRLSFKAVLGWPGTGQPPHKPPDELPFCAHMLAPDDAQDALFEVRDALLDPRFAEHALVAASPGIRFFAGVPLNWPVGARAGMLCVMDTVAGRLDDAQARGLRGLACLTNEALALQYRPLPSDETARDEQALRENEAFLDRTGRIARVGSWHADLRARTMHWSDQACRIHDLPPGHQVSLEDAMKTLAGDGRAVVERAIARSVGDGQPFDVEVRVVTATGRRIWVRMVGEVQVEAGRAVHVRGAVQDITERQQGKAELEREHALRLEIENHAHELNKLLRERDEMTQVLAHEVRQPLNNASAALQSAAALLLAQGDETASLRLGRAQTVMSQVLASIDNTLAVASLLARQGQAEGADTDIDTLVAVVLGDMPTSDRHRIRVRRDATSRTVFADMSLLRLALRNLLLNALAYSPVGTAVVVRLTDSDDPLALLIDVEDAGGGLAASLVPRLFERGTRGRHPGGPKGHGLGLYIVRRVMELHGGRVELVRNTPQGSTMRLVVTSPSDTRMGEFEPG